MSAALPLGGLHQRRPWGQWSVWKSAKDPPVLHGMCTLHASGCTCCTVSLAAQWYLLAGLGGLPGSQLCYRVFCKTRCKEQAVDGCGSTGRGEQ